MSIDAVDFIYVRNLVREQSAIVLDDHKAYLVEARLWELMLGLPVVRQDEAIPVEARDDAITGCIWITGAWEVTVLMGCSEELARKATARMFDKAS